MDWIDIYRAFHPKLTEYTFFSSAHGTFSSIDHMLGHKTSLDKFKKTEILSQHLLWPQWHKTGNQLQERNWKTHKNVKIKQHATKQTMDY